MFQAINRLVNRMGRKKDAAASAAGQPAAPAGPTRPARISKEDRDVRVVWA